MPKSAFEGCSALFRIVRRSELWLTAVARGELTDRRAPEKSNSRTTQGVEHPSTDGSTPSSQSGATCPVALPFKGISIGTVKI